ncbi:MAG: alpha/beta hydrolase-fold protein [Ferruginibacter sp.]
MNPTIPIENPNALFNFFEMSGPETAHMALKDVPHGRVEKVLYHSGSLNTERRMNVYLPPNYEKRKGKLPVLYLLHAGGDNDISWTSAGKANLILDNLYAEGKLKDMIVVMRSGHTPVRATPMSGGLDMDPFYKDFLEDIIPFIEKMYPVATKRENRAIAGFSMGGVQTLNLALWHPEKFAYVCPMSTGYFPDGLKDIEEKYMDVLKNPVINEFKLFVISMGKEDPILYKNCKTMMEIFDKAGIRYQYRETTGGHNFLVSRRSLLYNFPLLFR